MTISVEQMPKDPKSLIAQSSDPAVAAGEAILYPKDVSGAVEYFFRNSAGVVQLTNAGALNGIGEANTGSNVGSGDGNVFKQKNGLVLEFKRIQAGANITITDNADEIVIESTDTGEVNSGLNAGVAGQSVFLDKQGVNLRFKSIRAGTNMSVSTTLDNEVLLDATGESNTASNQGTGAGNLFKQKTGIDLEFRKIKAGSNMTVTQDGDDIVLDSAAGSGEANTASNATAGTGTGLVFKEKSALDLVLRKIKAGSNISVTTDTDDITIAATVAGESNTASNQGTGAGEIFKQKTGVDLEFRKIKAGANVTVTEDGDDIEIAAVGGGGASLQRYQASSNANEEVEVMATGTGITYARVGTTGTFSIPAGVRLLSARLRLPMATIGGTTFTVVYGTNGTNDGNSSYADAFPPMVQAWREDSGAQVAIASSMASGFDRLQATGLAFNQSNILRMQW